MIPKTKKLFISYRSLDHHEVDDIAHQLRSLRYDDGTLKYTTWQDKDDLAAGQLWWDGIVDAIIECDMFVFHLTPNYLDSDICMAELDYARKRGRPIIPIVLKSAYYISPRTQKPEIELKDAKNAVPAWLGRSQFLFYDNDSFVQRFEKAVQKHEQNWPKDIEIGRPLNPDADVISGNTYAVYATATDRALQVAFDEAKLLFHELVQRNDKDFTDICRKWLVLLDRYQDLLNARKNHAPRAVFQRKWDAYVTLFPLDFVDELYPDVDKPLVLFDPNNLGKQSHQAEKSLPIPPTNLSLMPEPFEWINIPGRRGTMQTNMANVTLEIPIQAYQIAKYPITNAQFAKFIEAGGYNQKKWWTDAGWQRRENDKWTEPRFWTNSKWNGVEQPVVGVSWYEAVAFCLWLSDVTGEQIMLPTEAQWQYAAQGDDGREYPWGDIWDVSRCNTKESGPGGTTSVRKYEGKIKGDSPFGVVDMAGNVWEWCLTDYQNGTDDASWRVLRGGSWHNSYDKALVVYRKPYNPSYRGYYFGGFRVVARPLWLNR